MEQICRRNSVAGLSSGKEVVGDDIREAVETRELSEGAEDFVDV